MLDQEQMKQRRCLRVGRLLQKTLSKLLHERDLTKSANGGFVAISRVEISEDLKHAKIFCTCFGTDPQITLAKLQQEARNIRASLAAKHMFRACPTLFFRLDDEQVRFHELVERMAKD